MLLYARVTGKLALPFPCSAFRLAPYDHFTHAVFACLQYRKRVFETYLRRATRIFRAGDRTREAPRCECDRACDQALRRQLEERRGNARLLASHVAEQNETVWVASREAGATARLKQLRLPLWDLDVVERAPERFPVLVEAPHMPRQRAAGKPRGVDRHRVDTFLDAHDA